MSHFRDYYHYLKNIRWILNNSLADTTIGSSSSSIIISNIQKKYHEQEEIGNSTIPNLQKWSEYKLKRLAEETRDGLRRHFDSRLGYAPFNKQRP